MSSDRLAWPLLLLLLTVLVPSAGVVWMMREAVRNERLATSQRLREAYEAQLASASQTVQERWTAQWEPLVQPMDMDRPAQAFSQIVSHRIFDSVLVCDPKGQILYPDQPGLEKRVSEDLGPDWAADWNRAERSEFIDEQFAKAAEGYAQLVRDHPQAAVRARARQAQIRCLLKVGERDSAIRVLEVQQRQEGVRDAQGRLFAATAELHWIELLDPKSESWQKVVGQLTQRLNDYEQGSLTSLQRRFLMTELQRLSPEPIALPTLAAETLAAEVMAGYEPNAAASALHQMPLPGLWAQASPDGRIVGLLRTATVRAQLLKLADGLPLPAGMEFQVISPEEPAQNWMAVALGERLGQWRLSLVPTEGDPFEVPFQQRWAMHVWIAMLVLAATFVMALLLVVSLHRRMRLAQLKNDLVATVSHELKTPLASIRLLVDTLLDDQDQPSNPKSRVQVREYLELISHENARLTRLIDNFLTFSRMERDMQRFDFQVVDTRDVLRQSVEVFQGHLGEGESCLQVDEGEPAYVFGDQDALVSAVVNLLENARKYSEGPKPIFLSSEIVGEEVTISVRDQGIGLNTHAASRVFDRFFQVDQQVARTQGGCGLGLSIVRAIAQAHCGKARVESMPGVGSTFVLSLPKHTADVTSVGDA